MENNLAKKIFEENALVSREHLDSVLHQGDLVNHDQAQCILQSEFEQDALAGFEKHQLNTSTMATLDKAIEAHLYQLPKGDPKAKFIIGGWFLVIFGILGLSYILNENAPIPVLIETSATSKNNTDEKNTALPNIPMQEHIAPEERFIFKQDQRSGAIAAEDESIKNDNRESGLDIPKKMDLYAVTNLDTRNKSGGIKKPMMKELVISNYVFVDYRGIRIEKKSDTELIQGTRASLGDSETSKSTFDLEDAFSKISYHDFLSETALIMSRGNWSESQRRLEIILKNFPDDLNAQFYMAYTLYNRSSYEASLRYLDQCTKSYYGNFDEEATWFKVKCYLALKQFDKAKKEALAVAQGGGFYADQAQELLKELK